MAHHICRPDQAPIEALSVPIDLDKSKEAKVVDASFKAKAQNVSEVPDDSIDLSSERPDIHGFLISLHSTLYFCCISLSSRLYIARLVGAHAVPCNQMQQEQTHVSYDTMRLLRDYARL
jgi:hypothetical protein